MKRLICLLVCFLLLLSGCANKSMTNFYYQRSTYLYDAADGVIVLEERDIGNHASHLEFLISLYLLGPLNKEYRSPFPGATKLMTLERGDNSLIITLNEAPNSLSDSQFSLACTCLTKTILELSSAESVTIVSGNRTVTLSEELITLYDTTVNTDATTGGSS